MATARLIGTASEGTTNVSADYFHLSRFIAEATGKVSEIKVYSLVAGNIKVAIYADSSGEPGARLSYNNTGQACSASQWNTLTIPELNITKDTFYWLAYNFSANGVVSRGTATGQGTQRFKSATYSTFTFPDPAGSGFTSATYLYSVAGWGVLVLTPSGISQVVAVGSDVVVIGGVLTLQPSGISQAVALGSPKLNFIIKPSGISQAIAFGTPGLVQFKYLIPDAAGDYTNIPTQYPNSGAHYDKVDDPVGSPDDTATYVLATSGSYLWDAYNLAAFGAGFNITVTSVTVYFRCANEYGLSPSYAKPGLRLDSSETLGTEVTLSDTAWHDYNEALSRPGGGSWTLSDLAILQVLIGLRTSHAYGIICTQVYVKVVYVVTGVWQYLLPSGIAQAVVIGTPAVQKLLLILFPSGISQAVAFGRPALVYHRLLRPTRILDAERVEDATRTIMRTRELEL